MDKTIRRVVTGHDGTGKAVVIADAPATNVRLRKANALTSTLLWATDESPADISGSTDRAARDIGVAPPPRGSVFRIVDFPPAAEVGAFDNAAMLKEMGLDGSGAPVRDASMHRTKSVDYAVVLSGEIDMLLDDSDVHLKAGDVVIQQGTNHAWVNRGKETCRIAFVLIDAEAPPQWANVTGAAKNAHG